MNKIVTALSVLLTASMLIVSCSEKKIDEKVKKDVDDFAAQLHNRSDSLNQWFAGFKETRKTWSQSRKLDSIQMALDKISDPALKRGWVELYNQLVDTEVSIGEWDTYIKADVDAVDDIKNGYALWQADVSGGKIPADSVSFYLQEWKQLLAKADEGRKDWNAKWQSFYEADMRTVEATRPLLDKLKK